MAVDLILTTEDPSSSLRKTSEPGCPHVAADIATDSQEAPSEAFSTTSTESAFSSASSEEGSVTDVKQVRFHSRVKCRRSKQPAIGLEERWYSRQEILSFRKRDKQLQQSKVVIGSKNTAVTDANKEEVENMTLLGLSTDRERKNRIRRIKEAKASVLGEQLCQEELFYGGMKPDDLTSVFRLNHDSIADFYSMHAHKSVQQARQRGQQMAKHVQTLNSSNNNINKQQLSKSTSAESLTSQSSNQEWITTSVA